MQIRLVQWARSRTLWRFLSAIAGASATSGMTLLAGLFFARELPEVAVGRYGLLTALVALSTLACTLGQPGALKRSYLHQPVGTFDWMDDLRQTLLIGVGPMAGALLCFQALYRFPPLQSFYLMLAVPAMGLLLTCTQLLIAHRFFLWGALLLRLPNALMLLPALLLAFGFLSGQLQQILLIQAGALLLCLAIGLLLLWRQVPRGEAHVPTSARLEGGPLLVLQLTALLPWEGLLALGGLWLSAEGLSALTAFYLLILRPFSLVQNIGLEIMMVEETRNRRKLKFSTLLTLALASLTLAMATAVLSSWLIGWLYSERFGDEGWLIVPLALIGGLLLIEMYPRSLLVGQTPSTELTGFAVLQLLIAGSWIGLAAVSTQWFGLAGLAWAGVGLAGTRAAGATCYCLWRRPWATLEVISA